MFRVQLGKSKSENRDQVNLSNDSGQIPAISIQLTPEQNALKQKAQNDFGQSVSVGVIPKHRSSIPNFLPSLPEAAKNNELIYQPTPEKKSNREWKFLPEPPEEEYGEDFVSIAAKNRLPSELAQLGTDPFVIKMAEMAVINRYKGTITSLFGSKPKPVEGTELTFLKGTIDLKVADFSWEGIHVKPGVDLMTIKTEKEGEFNINASLPINYKGQVSPDLEVTYSQGLPNPTAGQRSHLFIDSKVNYDSYDNNMGFKLGLRKQVSRDESLSLYGKYTKNFNPNEADDGGVGFYYKLKFD